MKQESDNLHQALLSLQSIAKAIRVPSENEISELKQEVDALSLKLTLAKQTLKDATSLRAKVIYSPNQFEAEREHQMQAAFLRESGMGYSQIAKQFGKSPSYGRYFVRRGEHQVERLRRCPHLLRDMLPTENTQRK